MYGFETSAVLLVPYRFGKAQFRFGTAFPQRPGLWLV